MLDLWTALALLLIAYVAMGLGLLAMGWRGRRVGGERRCRRCEYDLTGRPDAEACPECGRDLTRRRGVVFGVRRPRPMLIVGAVLALGLLWPTGSSVWGSKLNDGRWRETVPVWALRWEMGRAELKDLTPIRTEYRKRLDAGDVTPGEATRLVNDALADRAAGDLAWEQRWQWAIDLLRQPRPKGKPPLLPDPAWDRYVAVLRRDAMREAANPDAFTLTARDQLKFLMPNEKLTRAQAGPLIDWALDVQADRKRAWDPGIGDLLATASYAQTPWTPAQRERYLKQVLADAWRLEVRPRVRVGDPLPLRLVPTAHPRVSPNSLRYEVRLTGLDLVLPQGRRLQMPLEVLEDPLRGPDPERRPTRQWLHQGQLQPFNAVVPKSVAQLSLTQPGPVAVSLRYTMEVWPEFGTTGLRGTRNGVATASFDLVEAGQQTVRLMPQPALRGGIARSIRIDPRSSVRFDRWGETYATRMTDNREIITEITVDGPRIYKLAKGPTSYDVETTRQPILRVPLLVTSPPANLSYTVVVRASGREVGEAAVGFAVRMRGAREARGARGAEEVVAVIPLGDTTKPDRVDIILHPSAEPALRTVDMFEATDEEVVFRDVRVRW